MKKRGWLLQRCVSACPAPQHSSPALSPLQQQLLSTQTLPFDQLQQFYYLCAYTQLSLTVFLQLVIHQRLSDQSPKMRNDVRATVDRLDRPSAYYHNRVRHSPRQNILQRANTSQNKRRRDRDGDEEITEPQVDPLADATTLYVGNLYVHNGTKSNSILTWQVFLHNGRAGIRTVFKSRRNQASSHGPRSIQQDTVWFLLC